MKLSVRKDSGENTDVKPVNENLKRRSVIIFDYCGKRAHTNKMLQEKRR